jgi:hypothetical protein
MHNTVFIFFFKFEFCQEIEVFKPNHGILYILFLKFIVCRYDETRIPALSVLLYNDPVDQ